MRSVGRGVLAIALGFAVIVGAAAAERIGPAEPADAVRGAAVSSVWLCPHGGGEGWDGAIALADPGPDPVDVRLTELGADAASPPTTLTVPAGHEVMQPVRSDAASDATYVEVFGGWVAAGWVLRGDAAAPGVAAEPCAPAGARSWFVVDSDTEQHQHSQLVVMNPFSVDAVFDVALFRPRLPPLRSADWTDITLAPGRSRSLDVGAKLLGQPVVGVEVDVSRGRVAAASLSWSTDGGVRSVLATPAASPTWYLPVAKGAGQSRLEVLVPGAQGVQLTTQLLSSDAVPTAAGTAADTQQPAASTAGYPIISSGASSVDVVSSTGVPIVAAVRAVGRTGDAAATGGAPAPGPAWVVTPTIASASSHAGVVLVNPGDAAVDVTLRLLQKGATGAGPDTTLTVPPHRAVAAPARFLQQGPAASVLVISDGDIVALGTSSSGGKKGLDFYASAVGVRIPSERVGAL
jgi:Family of unknown function (DUF5719)